MASHEEKWDWRSWDSHKQRLATGLALAGPLAMVLGFAPIWAWALLVTAVSLIGLWELEGLFFHDQPPSPWRVLFFCNGAAIPISTLFLGSEGLLFSLVLGLFCGFIWMLISSPQDPEGIHRLSLLGLSWLYVPHLLSYALLLGQMEDGRTWIFFILLVVFACDSGAYYSGKRFGKHKLYERVSPKKTVEGSVGGVAMSIAAGCLFALLLVESLAIWKIVLLCGCLSVVSQVGDLIESMLKRIGGKKDSSGLLPGHGGLLDRLDSLAFAFPTTWFFLTWMI